MKTTVWIYITGLVALSASSAIIFSRTTFSHPQRLDHSLSYQHQHSGQGAADNQTDVDFVSQDGSTDIYINNRMYGPLQVKLSAGNNARNMQSLPALPITFLVNPNQRLLAARLQPDISDANMIRDIVSTGIPGDPRAFPDDVSYAMPVDENSRWELGQGFDGEFSHQDEQNRYAVDFIVPVGSPVLAARDGIVMDVASGFDRGGTDAKRYAQRANFIRVLHADGTMALYAHLQENGVLVKPGQSVNLGQHIAYSGNTGFTSGPHLHFALQMNTGMRLVSIPFRMVGPGGYLSLNP
jgi:murein DD-endopeptidase MepM/ murein hydrolase activator NlpD